MGLSIEIAHAGNNSTSTYKDHVNPPMTEAQGNAWFASQELHNTDNGALIQTDQGLAQAPSEGNENRTHAHRMGLERTITSGS